MNLDVQFCPLIHGTRGKLRVFDLFQPGIKPDTIIERAWFNDRECIVQEAV